LFFWLGQWLERDLAGKPGPTFPDRAQNLEFERRAGRPKRKPGQTTGQTILVAAEYSQESPKNNGKGRLAGQNCQAFSGL
jgi:hypothetical protein